MSSQKNWQNKRLTEQLVLNWSSKYQLVGRGGTTAHVVVHVVSHAQTKILNHHFFSHGLPVNSMATLIR